MAEYAIYKSNRVEVLERSGPLVKIMPEGGDEWSAYWAKNIDLRPVPQPKASKAVTVPTVVKTSEVEYTDLSWRPSDYTLAVQVRPSTHSNSALLIFFTPTARLTKCTLLRNLMP